MFIYLCYNVVCILCEWYALPPNRMQWVVTHMLTKNPYVIVLFSAAALGMLAGVGFGLLWPDGAMERYVLSPTAMAEADTLRQRLVLVGNVSIPVAKWMLFLFFCGFCAFCTPMTVLCVGLASLPVGIAFTLWHGGQVTVLSPLLFMLDTVATMVLAYRSFCFWTVLRDGHICRLYCPGNALLYGMCFRFFCVGGCFLLARMALGYLMLSFT